MAFMALATTGEAPAVPKSKGPAGDNCDKDEEKEREKKIGR